MMNAYAFAPDGYAVKLPEEETPDVVDSLFARSKERGDPVHTYDVTDRNGNPMQVGWVSFYGRVLYAYDD